MPLVAPRWLRLSRDAAAHIGLAFVWACRYGRSNVARFLLDRGLPPATSDRDRMTALHWAASNGSLEVTSLLLERGAPLEARNQWDGTVLGSTLYFASQQHAGDTAYPAVVELLLVAGADIRAVARKSTGDPEVDQILDRYRAKVR